MSQPVDNVTTGRWPHRLAVLLVCATFPLIGVGSLVTTYRAGMAVPDWPSTYGYNLFLYPWQTWVFGPFDLFVEHGHRLFAAMVGLLTIVMVVVTFRQETRKWVRQLALAALVLVVFQGVLGGARVIMNARPLALLHGCVAPLFFAVCVSLAVATSRRWRLVANVDVPDHRLSALARLAGLTTLMAYAQLVLGAHVRHVPVSATPRFFQVVVFAHLFMAAVLLVHISILSVRSWCMPRSIPVRGAVTWLAAATIVQFFLGPATWVMKYGWPTWLAETPARAGYVVQAQGFWASLVTSVHVVNGSLILGLCLLVCLRSFRFGSAAASICHSESRRLEKKMPNGSLQMGVVA